MFRQALVFLRVTWRSLVFIGTVIGLLYLWPDIKGLPAAYGYSWEWPMWLEREAVAYGALIVSLVWIFWIDVRSLVRQWVRKPIEIVYANEINKIAKYGPNKVVKILLPPKDAQNGKLHARLIYRIGIKNNVKYETLKNVNVVLHTIDKPTSFWDMRLPIADESNKFYVDIPPLRTVYFDLCKMIQSNLVAGDQVERIDSLNYRLLVGAKRLPGAIISGENGKAVELLKRHGYTAVIGVYADNKPAVFAEFTINAKDNLAVYFKKYTRDLYE